MINTNLDWLLENITETDCFTEMKDNLNSSRHKSERTDAASASLYSYPRDSNPRAAYKKLQKKFLKILKKNLQFFLYIKQLFSVDAKLFSKKNLN